MAAQRMGRFIGGADETDRHRGLAGVRSDALPEFKLYTDDGCEVAPKCLECPLPKCRYDVRGGARTMLNEVRDAEIARLRGEGWSPDDLAARYSVTRRTVFRILEQQRRAS